LEQEKQKAEQETENLRRQLQQMQGLWGITRHLEERYDLYLAASYYVIQFHVRTWTLIFSCLLG
jgi:hypothetical protein